MDADKLAIELLLKGMTQDQQTAALESIKESVAKAKAVQKQRIGENVQVVVQALKKIEADIRSRYDEVGNKIEKRVASIKNGQDGRDGKDGKDGKDGRPGRDGAAGPAGARGTDGLDGRDGEDGVSVTDAHIDFDGSLTITLSNGREINAGEVVAPDLAERIKVITNGGGTSQYVMDALESLENVILGAGTANGVAFLNASKVLVTGSALTFDGTNFANTAGTIAGGGLYSYATEGEGGQLSLANPTNTGTTASFDVVNATTARLFTVINNAVLQIGQLAGTGGVVSLHTNSTERMRIDSAGNVGIGTSSPDAGLTVIKSGTISSQVNVAARIGAGTTSDLLLGSVNGNSPFVASQGAYPLLFNTNSTERMRIDASGNLIQSAPTTPPTLTTTGQMVFNLTSDTNLRVSVRGSDGVTRTANITLT